MSERHVEIVEKQTVFAGYFRIDRYRVRHSLFSGGISGIVQREVFERGHAVAVLPYDPVCDTVILIEQFRIGAVAAGWEPWLLEIPAGIIDAGETSRAVAEREMQEETGCPVHGLVPIANYLVSPGGTSESLEIFCGRVDSSTAGGIHGLDHEDEDIKVIVLSVDEALDRLEKGEVRNAMTIVALQWLALNRVKLKDLWP